MTSSDTPTRNRALPQNGPQTLMAIGVPTLTFIAGIGVAWGGLQKGAQDTEAAVLRHGTAIGEHDRRIAAHGVRLDEHDRRINVADADRIALRSDVSAAVRRLEDRMDARHAELAAKLDAIFKAMPK